MTHIYSVVVLAFFSLLPLWSNSQANVVSLEPTPSSDRTQCYNITLTSNGPTDAYLATQNFRLYYDASVLRFDRLSAESLLPNSGYKDLKVMQAVHNSNASGFGGLEFGANLGYINLSINDRMDISNLLPILPNNSMELASICFEIVEPNSEPALVWARDPLTAGYSSAYTEISHYRNGELKIIENLEFRDIDASWASHPEKMVDSGTTKEKR